MRKQRIVSSGSGRRPATAPRNFTDLDDCPKSYADKAGQLVIVKGDESGLEFNTEPAIDAHDVKAAASDSTPKFLESKIIAGTGLSTSLITITDSEKAIQIDAELDENTITTDGETGAIKVKGKSLTPDQINDLYIDGEPATPSLRTLGEQTNQAAPGNNSLKVKASAADGTPGYLVAKLEAAIALSLTEDETDPDNHKAKLSVVLGTQSDQAAAGNDERFLYWQKPIIKFFDNSTGLPVLPNTGDRYVALAGGFGWTIDNIYTYNGATWDGVAPSTGMALYSKQDATAYPKGHYYYSGGGWFRLDSRQVWASSSDTNAGFLIEKTEAGTAIAISEDSSVPANHKIKIAVQLGNQSDQAAAGNDDRFAKVKVNSADSTAQYLEDKLQAGNGIDLLTLTDSIKAIEILAKVNGTSIGFAEDGALEVPLNSLTTDQINEDYIDGTAATPSMRTLGTQSDQACAGNDSRLSDSRAPTAHAIAGALHTADTLANIQSKVSDGSLITSAAGEINALAAKTTPTASDIVIIEDAADSFKKKKCTFNSLPQKKQFSIMTDPFEWTTRVGYSLRLTTVDIGDCSWDASGMITGDNTIGIMRLPVPQYWDLGNIAKLNFYLLGLYSEAVNNECRLGVKLWLLPRGQLAPSDLSGYDYYLTENITTARKLVSTTQTNLAYNLVGGSADVDSILLIKFNRYYLGESNPYAHTVYNVGMKAVFNLTY
jgi:hypothetical protein